MIRSEYSSEFKYSQTRFHKDMNSGTVDLESQGHESEPPVNEARMSLDMMKYGAGVALVALCLIILITLGQIAVLVLLVALVLGVLIAIVGLLRYVFKRL